MKTDKKYALGGVKPHVQSAANLIGNKFDVNTIYGVGIRAGQSDHPKGLALDFMVGTDKAKGDAIAAYVVANWSALGVEYIIWQQSIKESAGAPWDKMENRGSTTANHFDHPHVSFKPAGGDLKTISDDPGTIGGFFDIPGSPRMGDMVPDVPYLKDIHDMLSFFIDPTNWWRVFLFLVGGALIVIVLWRFINNTKKG